MTTNTFQRTLRTAARRCREQSERNIAFEKIHNDPTVPSKYRNSTLYYHYNHRGDVVSVSDGSGKHVWQSDYDAFGQPLPVKSEFAAFDPRYTFSTKRYFAELRTYYYGYRWYLPELCRWLQKDPIALRGMAINYYSYCLNTPLYIRDVFGLANQYPRLQRALIVVGSSTTVGSDPHSTALKLLGPVAKAVSVPAHITRDTLAESNAEKFRQHNIVADVVKEPSKRDLYNTMNNPATRPDIFVFYGHGDANSFQINHDETYGYDQLPNGCFSLLVMECCYSAQTSWYEKKLGQNGTFAGNGDGFWDGSIWFNALYSQHAIEMYLMIGPHGGRYGTRQSNDEEEHGRPSCPMSF